ncbi:ATP-binding protein [Polycladomyces subterraneus]|uniref:ATP-binding protein n=1 Tax=Polycladomyces subterraneus TaxID=1016997 RepID=UPI003F4E0EAF
MIWRSVVGKLWLTIIGLVTLLLVMLSAFLSDQVEKTHQRSQQESLLALAHKIQHDLEKKGAKRGTYLRDMLRISELFDTYMIVLGPDGAAEPIGVSPTIANVPWQQLLEKTDIDRVLRGKTVVMKDRVFVEEDEGMPFPLFKEDILMVAVPLKKGSQIEGAVVLYRTQNQLQSETDIKKWIYYSAIIGFFLTTIFAFFLSTRITQPLKQMKKAAERMAKGEFNIRVPVRQHERDEIGDLAATFNRMAEQLEELVHALSHEKEQLASILRSMADGVITLDADGRVVLTNPPAERFLSAWADEMAETLSDDPKERLPLPLREIFETVVEDEQEHFGDIEAHGRTWAVVMAPLYANEQVRGVVAVLRDVTDERRLDKLRKDFVANVSHELRTPLAMLQGYSEALLDDIAQSPEERRELVQVIHDESLRMGRLVRELLDLARMEAGHIEIVRSSLRVSELMERLLRKFHTIAREQGVQLEGEVEPDLPTVYWDEDKMEQVLTNLVDNAIRHTSRGGRVSLQAMRTNGSVRLIVQDTGSGIPEEDLPFIFERFYKADKARTRGQAGTGLGLAIVKHIVNAHGGNVTVTSKVGEGTTFVVQLPIGTPTDTTRERDKGRG